MSEREHATDNGADCWCEPRIITLVQDGDGTERIIVHHRAGCAKFERCRCHLETPEQP